MLNAVGKSAILLAPLNSISLGFGVTAWAAVPEAAISEHGGDALDGKHQIRTTRARTDSHGVSKSQLPNDAQYPSLGLGSADCRSTHTLRNLAGVLERRPRETTYSSTCVCRNRNGYLINDKRCWAISLTTFALTALPACS